LLLDGELPSEERPGLEEHLAACRDCASARDGERELRTALREKAKLSAPSGLSERVRGALRQPPRLLPRWFGVAAAGLLVVLLGIAFLRSGGTSAEAFAAEAVRVHEESRATMPGICLRPCCTLDAPGAIRDYCRGKVDREPCLHELEGYLNRAAGIRGVYCWTQQVNATGQLVTHTLVGERLTAENLALLEREGRAVLLFSRPDGFT
jgi:hypothetical protein